MKIKRLLALVLALILLCGCGVQEVQQEVQQEGYVPRPWWQVWGARIALVVFIIGLIMYYCNIFGAVR